MGREYRDDLGAAHERIEQLAKELEAARRDKADLCAAQDQIDKLERELQAARRAAEVRSSGSANSEKTNRKQAHAGGDRGRPPEAQLVSSSLFYQKADGRPDLTRRGSWVFWILISACLLATVVINLILYPIERWQVVAQAILNALFSLPAAAFLVVPALMGRHFATKEPGWGAISWPVRAGLVLGGLLAMGLFILMAYKLGVANHWEGGDIF